MNEKTFGREELHKKLEELGVSIGKSTLKKYISEYKLADQPTVISLGRAKGRASTYSEKSLCEIYAAWKLLNGNITVRLLVLQKVRKMALALIEEKDIIVTLLFVESLGINITDLAYIIELWINYYLESLRTQRFLVLGIYKEGYVHFELKKKPKSKIKPSLPCGLRGFPRF